MIVERRVRRHGPVMVKLDTGEWMPEDEYNETVSDEASGTSDEEE